MELHRGQVGGGLWGAGWARDSQEATAVLFQRWLGLSPQSQRRVPSPCLPPSNPGTGQSLTLTSMAETWSPMSPGQEADLGFDPCSCPLPGLSQGPLQVLGMKSPLAPCQDLILVWVRSLRPRASHTPHPNRQ